MSEVRNISVAYGDGIGPEIMEATLSILKKAGARINIETIEIGEKLYAKGISTGISENAWESVKRNKILLKAPITTPQGKGYKSLNVTFRKALGLYANVRPAVSYYPFIDGKCKKMDMVIVRENEEDLYAGVEYRTTPDYTISYKIITRKGSEKIIRYAFDYAKLNNRKKVTCLIKDNIMKITDGMFHNIFKDVAKEYPEIEAASMIVDIGSARIASKPEDFDVIVTQNLYGDIVSDIAAEVSGSVGLAGSFNMGDECAMFEAVHGSAPDIAGKGIANPSGLLNGAILMLEHIGQGDIGAKIKNAWLKTLEDGIHTGDIYKEGVSKQKVGTKEFADAVISNLGKEPSKLTKAVYKDTAKVTSKKIEGSNAEQKLIGIDINVSPNGITLDQLANNIKDLHPDLNLYLISQRGLKVWPNEGRGDVIADHVRCRFIGYEDKGVKQSMLWDLCGKISETGVEITLTNSLFTFDGELGFTKAQGE